jgi:hypothetical protein
VYRVSHVVDGKFTELLRQNHSNPYHVAAEPGDLHSLTPILATQVMFEPFSRMPGCGYLPRRKQKQEKRETRINKQRFGGCFLPID